MMKKHVFIFCLALAFMLSACNNFLDLKPKGIVIPENFEDYEKLINYAQLLKSSEAYPVWFTDDPYLPDEGEISFEALTEPSDINLYTFQSQIFGDAETDFLWEGSYNRIYYYNVIIDDIMDIQDASEADKLSLKAEALVGRGFEYLTLVNAYAKHYDQATSSTDPGVPLMLDKQINKSNLQRATVKEVYDQIMRDLDTAALYLPDQPVRTAYRASKPVGLGMLARMYLYMGDYSKALDYAVRSLELNSTVLSLSQFSVVDPEKSIGRTDYPKDAKDNPENIYIRLAPWTFGFSSTAFGSDDLMTLFGDNDIRRDLFFTKYFYGVTYDHYLWAPYVYANMAMSVPEMLLIAAECEARIGSKDEAMKYLDKLMEHRIRNYTPRTAASNEDALVQVLNERRREFCMLGCVRLIDLKRLNREERFAKTITRTVNGNTYTLEPNSPKYILPIPPNILVFNPGMQQNER